MPNPTTRKLDAAAEQDTERFQAQLEADMQHNTDITELEQEIEKLKCANEQYQKLITALKNELNADKPKCETCKWLDVDPDADDICDCPKGIYVPQGTDITTYGCIHHERKV